MVNHKDRTMMLSILAICVGASVGALARWLLGNSLNALFPAIPLGTLAANLIGGYLIGVALALFAEHPGLPPEWQLLVITGFLGGLTTFSTFSAEVTGLLQQGRLAWACAAIASHVVGSLAMTLLGLASWVAFKRI
jgi:CrcB protein